MCVWEERKSEKKYGHTHFYITRDGKENLLGREREGGRIEEREERIEGREEELKKGKRELKEERKN